MISALVGHHTNKVKGVRLPRSDPQRGLIEILGFVQAPGAVVRQTLLDHGADARLTISGHGFTRGALPSSICGKGRSAQDRPAKLIRIPLSPGKPPRGGERSLSVMHGRTSVN
ncbi:hypothetical protein KOF26_05555 [Sphingomonas sp. XMGL2]|uniref:Uncharacterized protein n=1 Tax=Sphingomonas quercus TaxID=2842451 RepID=A0ABS6BGA0_9SPHN|nr:hypothetical protein [Sphingomonas quercus]MBU3077328.1 hypothetical protein [Sphingomonas quercus]